MESGLLDVIVPADERLLVSVETCRARLKADASEDATIRELLEEVSSAIDIELGTELALQSYRWTVEGDGGDLLYLPRHPLEEGSISVTIDGEADTDWSLLSRSEAVLYREGGWTAGCTIAVTFSAGYLLPPQVQTWSAGIAYSGLVWVRPATPRLSWMMFQADAVGGTSGGTEPVWETTAGETVVDNGVTWTARNVLELPSVVRQLAIAAARVSYDGLDGVTSVRAEGFAETYEAGGSGPLSTVIRRGLSRLRLNF